MQLRLKGDICRLQAIAYNAQKHFFAWLRLHYAGSARKAFLQTFGLRAFRNGVEEGYKLRAIAEAVYCRFLKIRTLRAFAQFRLLQEQAQAAEAVATRRYTRSLLRKGMKGWRKWHAYIGACSKLLMVASQLNASRHQDTLLTVLRAWREAAIRSETEYSRLVALALPRRVKAAFRKWLRWARLSSWLREKRRLHAQSQTAELFRRWRSLSQESTTAGKTIQRDISFSLNEKRKIRLAAAVRSWRALASGRASARRAYNACLTERKRKLFTHLREVAFLWGVQRDLAREKALRYAQNVLLYWHRLTRRRKRERFVLRCLVTSRDEKVLTAAWRDWKRAATFNRLATDFGDRRIAVRAFNSWKLLSAQRRRLQKSSAYFVARAAANWQRQRFEQWAALVRFRRSAKFQVFSLWRQAARIRRHHRAVAAHVAARKDRNTLGTLWRAWREQLAEAEQVRTFQLRQQGRKVLGALIAYFEYREAKRARDEDILSAWAKATTEKLLHVWSEAAHYRWRLRTAYNQVVSHRRHSVLLSFFTVWLHETEFALSCGGTMTSGGGCAPASPTGATQTSGFWTADRPALSEMTESGVAVEDAVQARLKKHLSNAPTTSIWNHRKESDAAQVAASPAASSGENSTDTSRPSWSPTLERASWGSSPIRVQTLRPFTGLKTHDLAGPERESRKGGQASSLQLTPFRKRQSGSLLQAFAAWRRLAEQSRDASELRRSGDERERTETRHRTKQRVPFIRRASDPHWLETDAARLAYKKAHCFRVVKVQQRGFRTWRAFMSTKHCIVTRLQDEFRAVRAMRKWKAAFARRKTLHALAHVQCHYLQDIEHPKPSRGYPSE
ncbi:hypothetical protein BESB_016520 [Besnoitia besnoiti]|uniref:Sfi1 spindle body domain-containing protein n=1 Tax=Besnoitia besnoiti TaxID=94643 RepID=A0A2A9M557_BESBE|nr:hypothetical protein BESB_016520 [Besnoitia besnoiti]PFH32334.1 hypothetical protein BESB_016520 [Besnoitia besnoiti]